MSTVTELPRRMRDAVSREFQGERILWTGRPNAWHAFRVSMLIWLFAVPWTAFALGWEFMALQGWLSGKPAPSMTHQVMGIVFPLFGVPFVVVGLAMMHAPFWAWSLARRTVHIVADRRIVTLTVGRVLKVKSHPISGILRVERSEHRDGSGTLKLVTGMRRDSDGDKVEDSETLYGVKDVRKLEHLILEQAERVRRAA